MVDRPDEIRDPSLRSFGIQAIAVNAEVQGKGVGKLLMKAAEEAARSLGFKRMHLTVHVNNSQAIAFYGSTGWEKEIVHGRWNHVMRKSL
jgi:GNAT superfamily N-acetyltransferase